MDTLIVVDCQNDFIDGSLACKASHEAVEYLIRFINSHDVDVFYTADWHSPTNRSFAVNGGIWPVHCVAGQEGAMLDFHFSQDVRDEKDRPNDGNIYRKGKDDEVEEYSAFHGMNEAGRTVAEMATPHVYVGGIASEYCVKETVLSLLKAGHSVTLLVPGVGYVDQNDHIKAIKEMKALGVELIEK